MPSPRPIFPLLGALGTIGVLLTIRGGEGNLRLLLGQAGNDGQGFCCVRDGQPCLQMGIEECDQANGLGFTGDQPSCARLCGTQASSARPSSAPPSSRPPQSSVLSSRGSPATSAPTSRPSSQQRSVQGTSTTECNDGIDNDADGFTDFPDDYTCTSAKDTTEKFPLEIEWRCSECPFTVFRRPPSQGEWGCAVNVWNLTKNPVTISHITGTLPLTDPQIDNRGVSFSNIHSPSVIETYVLNPGGGGPQDTGEGKCIQREWSGNPLLCTGVEWTMNTIAVKPGGYGAAGLNVFLPNGYRPCYAYDCTKKYRDIGAGGIWWCPRCKEKSPTCPICDRQQDCPAQEYCSTGICASMDGMWGERCSNRGFPLKEVPLVVTIETSVGRERVEKYPPTTYCYSKVCQNGKVEEGEECDDGNSINNDRCDDNCKLRKGGGTSSVENSGVSSPLPTLSVCGNGKRESSEECDDGNEKDSDGCSAWCTVENGWQCTENDCSSQDSRIACVQKELGSDFSAAPAIEKNGTKGTNIFYWDGSTSHATMVHTAKLCSLETPHFANFDEKSLVSAVRHVTSDYRGILLEEACTEESWNLYGKTYTLTNDSRCEGTEDRAYKVNGPDYLSPREGIGDGGNGPAFICKAQDVCVTICGDGVILGTEECDPPSSYGNPICTADCKLGEEILCGNGQSDLGEECNDGGLSCPSGKACNANTCLCLPKEAQCGDGTEDPGEQCGEPGLWCAWDETCNENTCQCRPVITSSSSSSSSTGWWDGGNLCGNGNVDPLEKCGEIGLYCSGTDTCNYNTCFCQQKPAECGDFTVDPGEQCGELGLSCAENETCDYGTCHCQADACQPGSTDGDKSCPASSSASSAGWDGGGEGGDYGWIGWSSAVTTESSEQSSAIAKLPACGDDRADTGEECGEPGLFCNRNQTCNQKKCRCLALEARCGDNDPDPGEECGEPGFSCNRDRTCNYNTCLCLPKTAKCGDFNPDPGEECGDGGLSCARHQTCNYNTCKCMEKETQCGDGNPDPGEECGEGILSCPSTKNCNYNTCLCLPKTAKCGDFNPDPREECGDAWLSCNRDQVCDWNTCKCLPASPPPSPCSEVIVPANTDQGLRYDHRKPTGQYRIEITSPTGLSDDDYAKYTWANWPTDDRARHHGSSLFLLQNRNIEWSPDTDPVTSPLGGERVSNSNFSFDSLLLNPPYNQSHLRVADAARGIGTTVNLNDGDSLLFIVNAIRGIGTQQGAFSENRGNVHISICPASPTPASLSLTSSFSSSPTSPPSSTEQSSGAQSSLHLLSSTANGGTNSTGTSYQFISPNGTPYKLLPTITPEGVPGYIFQTPGVRGGTSLLTPVTLPNGTPGYLWTSPNGTSTYFASSPSPVPGTYQFQNPTGEVSYLSPAGSPPPPSSYQFIAPDGTALTLLPTITPEGTPGYVFQTTGAGGGTSLLISMMLPDGNIGSVLRAPDGSLTSFLRSSTVSQESFTFRSPTGSSVPLRPLALPSSLHASAPEEGSCGDGIVQTPDEQCEPSLHNPALPFACKNCRFFSQFCGDGKTDPGEECDDGPGNADQPNIRCRSDCGYARCGDGILDSLLEQCDFRDSASSSLCNRACKIEQPFDTAQGKPVASPPPFAFLSHFSAMSGEQLTVPWSPSYPPTLRSQLPAPSQPKTGPEILAIMAAGAAGGFAWMRRRRS